jgi:hypothetical protein
MTEASLDALFLAFCDEDTRTWTEAARAIGKRAHHDPRAAELIARWLERGEDDDDINIHRFRHACCALASYLSEEKADLERFAEAIDREVRIPLIEAIFGCLATEGTVGDLQRVPQLAAAFEKWKKDEAEKLAALVEKLRAAGNTRGEEHNQRRLDILRSIEPRSAIPKEHRPDLGSHFHDLSPWALASYFAGVTSARALLELPFEPMVKGLLSIALERKSAGLPLVLNLPQVFNAVRADVPEESWRRALTVLEDSTSVDWAGDRLHYNEYIENLAAISERKSFLELWTNGIDLPPWIRDELTAITELAKEGGSAAARRSGRLLRRITREFFSDDWRWEELEEGSRFSLNVYSLLLLSGVGSLAPSKKKTRELRLVHRVAIVLEGIKSGANARDQVLPALVRCLKILLGEELIVHRNKPDLGEILRRQVAIVQPLIAEWQLPGTLRKDLATIVCRVLEEALRGDRATFVDLLFTILFALPDQVIFREMLEYSTDERLGSMIRAVVEVIENAGGDHALTLYARFVDKLSTITAGTREEKWVRHLSALVRRLARIGELGDAGGQESPAELSAIETALMRLLDYGCRASRAWDSTAINKSSDKKGERWAEREAAAKLEQDARSRFDRFQRVLDDVELLEADCLPESGRPHASKDLVRRWRRLLSSLDELLVLCSRELPYLEREICTRLLKLRIAHLEERLHSLVRVLEREDEEIAVSMIQAHIVKAVELHSVPSSPAKVIARAQAKTISQDAILIEEWMLDRYMIRELARTMKLRVLGLICSPVFVGIWLALPFLSSAVIHHLGFYAWRGLPFAVITVLNVVLLAGYFLEARGARVISSSTSRFLLPQITAALFLGMVEVLSTDEAWSLAVFEYPWVRTFTVTAFLAAGFFFTREVLLKDQLRTALRKKTKRAASVMALVLWQSFVLVGFFGVLGGRLMGDRAEITAERLEKLPPRLLPHEVDLGENFLAPAESNLQFPRDAAFRIFPWAMLTWTVQVFFFSAVFERIMQRRGD